MIKLIVDYLSMINVVNFSVNKLGYSEFKMYFLFQNNCYVLLGFAHWSRKSLIILDLKRITNSFTTTKAEFNVG